MPEGPEAYNIAKCIDERFRGLIIEKIKVKDKGKLNNFEDITLPQTIKRVYSIGKKIIIEVEHKKHNIHKSRTSYYSTSLGMEGSYVYSPDNHCNVVFYINDHDIIFHLYYRDVRRFGSITYFEKRQDYKNYINKLGPDMLNNPPSEEEFQNIVYRYPKKIITSFLLEQEIIAGIGNYLKSEILYRSKINPERLMSDLKRKEIKRLYHSIIFLINESKEKNGLTIKSYQTPDNKKGTFITSVYQKERDLLNNKILKFMDKKKRITYWVPNIQK